MLEIEGKIKEIEDVLKHIIRIGEVVQLYPDKGTVRVLLHDADEQLSYELAVINPKTKEDKFYYMPDVGEHVLCVFLPYGREIGFVIGAIYSKEDKVPVADKDKWHKVFKDGTVIEYDRKIHRLYIDVKGDLEMIIKGDAKVRVDGHASISAGNCISFSCDKHGGGVL